MVKLAPKVRSARLPIVSMVCVVTVRAMVYAKVVCKVRRVSVTVSAAMSYVARTFETFAQMRAQPAAARTVRVMAVAPADSTKTA